MRKSTTARACSAMTLVRVPPATTSTLTVIPRRALPKFITRSICSATSCTALTPASGFTPACAARPRTTISTSPTPLRAVFSRPSSPVAGSSTSTASLRLASRSMGGRDVLLPISSSEVHRKTTRLRGAIRARRSASAAKSAITSPPFMSNVPGPYARPPRTRKGTRWSVSRSYTVSRWPRTRICPRGFSLPLQHSARMWSPRSRWRRNVTRAPRLRHSAAIRRPKRSTAALS